MTDTTKGIISKGYKISNPVLINPMSVVVSGAVSGADMATSYDCSKGYDAQAFSEKTRNPTRKSPRIVFKSEKMDSDEKEKPGYFWRNQKTIGSQLNRSPQFTRPLCSGLGGCGGDDDDLLSTKQSKALFIHQTLNYVFGQLCITVAITAWMYRYRTEAVAYIDSHSGIMFVPIAMTFVTMLSLFCCTSGAGSHVKRGHVKRGHVKRGKQTCSRQCLFWLFTISCGTMVAVGTIPYAPNIVLKSSITLLVMVGGIDLLALRTARRGEDLTYMAPCLFGVLSMVVMLVILNIFVRSSILGSCIAAISVVLFSLLLMYDLNRLYMAADEGEFADPLLCAINIYLDVINLFLNLLQIFNGGSSE